MSARTTLAASSFALLLTCTTAARSADTWSTPYPGVRHLYRTTSDPLRIHALVVDLCAPGVSLRATSSSERKRTVSSFGTLVGAEAAINGDFFSYSSYATTGLSIGNGDRWTDTQDSSWSVMAAFGPQMAAFSPASEVVSSPPSWMNDVVSGHPEIVRDGAAITSYDCSGHFCQRHPRTAAGFSRNRRTLTLVVVDGRTTVSIGVTLAQLANLMVDLGAHDALNLDGGGSTTMWIKSDGVVNAPSDGSQRVVANHLAIQAGGGGMPGSCTEDPEEAVFLDPASTTTDIDGDGKADMCERAAAGFRCHLSDGSSFGTGIDGPELSDATGWNGADNYGTLRMGDVTGDGLADVCARANAGMRCWPSTGSGFGAALTGPEWSDATGWNDITHYGSIRLVDVTGDGLDDLCARGADGLVCHASTGSGFGGAMAGPTWTDASGWAGIDHYGTIRFGDLDADGKADVCARAAKGIVCALSTGTGFGGVFDGPAWSDANGWDQMRYWSTIRMSDIDGDGRMDLCGRSATGVVCHRSEGAGFGAAITGPELSDASGWGDWTNYLTIRMADVTGDGRADLCARANAGLRCWPSTGQGFEPSFAGPAWSDAEGWYEPKYFATLRMADLNGDGRADACARGADRVHCYLSDGAGFPTHVEGPPLADSVGWGATAYWSTLRVAGPRPMAVQPDAGVEGGVDASADGSPDAATDVSTDGGSEAFPDAYPDTDTTEGGSEATVPSDASLADGNTSGSSGSSSEVAGGDDGGCACHQAGGGKSGWWLPWVGIVFLFSRRRRPGGVRQTAAVR
jgi:MYXO-CTERM domain-containing protein